MTTYANSHSINWSDINSVVFEALKQLYDDVVNTPNLRGDYTSSFLSSTPLILGQPPPVDGLGNLIAKADKLQVIRTFQNAEPNNKKRFYVYYDIEDTIPHGTTENPIQVYKLNLVFVDYGERTADGKNINQTDHTHKLFNALSKSEHSGFCPELLYKAQTKQHGNSKLDYFYDFHRVKKNLMQTFQNRDNQSWQLQSQVWLEVSINSSKTNQLIP